MTSDIEQSARAALASSHIFALHFLEVEQDGARLLITGRVRSFYHKQLAQEVVRAVAEDLHVVNGIDVDDVPS